MRKSRVFWMVIAVLGGGVLIGLAISVNIVRVEGFEGLWKRKKDAVEVIIPGSRDSLEAGERKFREATSDPSQGKER